MEAEALTPDLSFVVCHDSVEGVCLLSGDVRSEDDLMVYYEQKQVSQHLLPFASRLTDLGNSRLRWEARRAALARASLGPPLHLYRSARELGETRMCPQKGLLVAVRTPWLL